MSDIVLQPSGWFWDSSSSWDRGLSLARLILSLCWCILSLFITVNHLVIFMGLLVVVVVGIADSSSAPCSITGLFDGASLVCRKCLRFRLKVLPLATLTIKDQALTFFTTVAFSHWPLCLTGCVRTVCPSTRCGSSFAVLFFAFSE